VVEAGAGGPVSRGPVLVVLVGPAGSGKSTWAARRFGRRAVVSTDRIRGLLCGDETDQDANLSVFAVLHLAVAERLKRGQLVVADATNLHPDHRRLLLGLAHAQRADTVAVLFRTSLDECLRRNAERRRHVPEDVLLTQYADAAVVTEESLHAEGWARAYQPGGPRRTPEGVDSGAKTT
jgi:predicted kinase